MPRKYGPRRPEFLKYFSVYDRKTDKPVFIHGTAWECAKAMGAIMGVEVGEVTRKVALVRCSGRKKVTEDGKELGVKAKGVYEGISDCLAASKVAGKGPLACEYGCLGFGTCLKACKYGALSLKNGRAYIDADKCVGCMSCVEVCPRHVIAPVPYEADIVVACNSHAKGGAVSKACNIGCLGCGKCEQHCPQHIAIRQELKNVQKSLEGPVYRVARKFVELLKLY